MLIGEAPWELCVIGLAADNFEPSGGTDAGRRIKSSEAGAPAWPRGKLCPNGVVFGRFCPDVAVLDALEERLWVELAIVRRPTEQVRRLHVEPDVLECKQMPVCRLPFQRKAD